MKQENKILEATVNGSEPNIATSDENLTIEEIYRQLNVPSLGKQIFHNYTQSGPTAAIFSLDRKDNEHVEVLRAESICYNSKPIDTAITNEAIQDMISQFGMNAKFTVAVMLRGLANEQENEKTAEFLDDEAVAFGNVTLSNKNNSKVIVEEITQIVQESIMDMNKERLITYSAKVVLPAKYAGSFTVRDRGEIYNDGYYVGSQGRVKYFSDPDVSNTDTIYVVLSDFDKSGAFFSSYTNDIVWAQNPDTGNNTAFIYNRFAITANPRHIKTSSPQVNPVFPLISKITII